MQILLKFGQFLILFLSETFAKNIKSSDNLTHVLTAIQKGKNCHTHFVIDENNSKYIKTFSHFKSLPTPLTINYIHKKHISYFNDSELFHRNETDQEIVHNLTSFPYININSLKLQNNHLKCLLIFILLGQNRIDFLQHDSIQSSGLIFKFKINEKIGIPFTDRLSIFLLMQDFPKYNLGRFRDRNRFDVYFKYYDESYKWPTSNVFYRRPHTNFPYDSIFLLIKNSSEIQFICKYCNDTKMTLHTIPLLGLDKIKTFIMKNYPSSIIGWAHYNFLLPRSLAEQALKNVTILPYGPFDFPTFSMEEEQQLFDHAESRQWLHQEGGMLLHRTIVVTRTSGYGFITCWSKPIYSLEMYYTPFKPNLWICFSLTVLMLALLKSWIFDKVLGTLIGNILLVLAPILEDFSSVPSAIMNKTGFKIVFLLWMLEAVIITQYYGSSLISSLVSPKEAESVWTFKDIIPPFKFYEGRETFKKLIQSSLLGSKSVNKYFNIYIRNFHKNYVFFDLFANSLFQRISDSLQSAINKLDKFDTRLVNNWLQNLNVPDINKTLEKYGTPLESYVPSKEVASFFYLYGEISFPFNLYFTPYNEIVDPLNESVIAAVVNRNDQSIFEYVSEEILVKCGRSVYADTLEYLESFYDHLTRNYYWITFYKSKETVFDSHYGWWFQHTTHSNFPQMFKLFFASGCYNYWIRKLMYEGMLRRKKYTTIILKSNILKIPGRVNPLGLETRLDSFFHVWLFLISFAFIYLIIELLRKNGYLILVRTYFKIARVFKAIIMKLLQFLEWLKG